ncbi:MAG: putative phospholipid ABC transporter permease protein MlaE [Deltaproteobacteria bacterium ADurb.Bin058]|nr:MAG: putative phospholipid ABC transporter permease protein MlaE [Deltaproteobacteria bacterium ADurb.Bin058]
MSKPLETDSFLGNFGRTFITAFQTVGAMTLLQLRIFRSLLAIKNFDYDESVTQLFKVGVRSLPVVVATATFVGALMVIASGNFVRATGATTLIGWAAGTAVFSEVGPVLIGLMFSGRVGANNTAELGTMVVTNQVDALRVLGIDPIGYLIVPRFIAMIVMLFLLTAIGDLFALAGGSVACRAVLGIDMRIYWQGILDSNLLSEFIMGLVKAIFFGGAVGIVSCHWGLQVTGGARGVGRAVNDSVVTSAIAIFVVNFFITVLWT